MIFTLMITLLITLATLAGMKVFDKYLLDADPQLNAGHPNNPNNPNNPNSPNNPLFHNISTLVINLITMIALIALITPVSIPHTCYSHYILKTV